MHKWKLLYTVIRCGVKRNAFSELIFKVSKCMRGSTIVQKLLYPGDFKPEGALEGANRAHRI